jgi:predicted nucleotidyltransferase
VGDGVDGVVRRRHRRPLSLCDSALEQILGREVDLVDYGGLDPRLDDDVRREAMLL